MNQFFLLGVTIFLFSGCKGLSQRVDQASFTFFGGTLFSSPQQVSMKEVHLDDGTLLGHDVIIEGKLIKKGDHLTHIVVSDENAQMLVVLANIADIDKKLGMVPQDNVRVLGTVERGKKGLPFIMAKVVTAKQVQEVRR